MAEKVIIPAQACIGMHVKRIGSSWIEHPFWFKTSFDIRDDEQLRRVVACGLPITIDTSKGCDVREAREAPRCEAVATVVGATVVGAAVVGAAVVGAAAVGDAAAGAAAAGDAVIGDTPAGAAGRQREPAGPPVSSEASALSEASVPSAC